MIGLVPRRERRHARPAEWPLNPGLFSPIVRSFGLQVPRRALLTSAAAAVALSSLALPHAGGRLVAAFEALPRADPLPLWCGGAPVRGFAALLSRSAGRVVATPNVTSNGRSWAKASSRLAVALGTGCGSAGYAKRPLCPGRWGSFAIGELLASRMLLDPLGESSACRAMSRNVS